MKSRLMSDHTIVEWVMELVILIVHLSHAIQKHFPSHSLTGLEMSLMSSNSTSMKLV